MNYIAHIDLNRIEKLRADLEAKGFTFTQPAHTLFQAKSRGITLTLYPTGKVMVQGKASREFIESYLEPTILETFTLGYEHLNLDLTARIGVDESGKGDFFGPLCIAGLFAEGEGVKRLQALGVKDSKKISDANIKKLAQMIRKEFLHHLVRIHPEKYNALYEKFGNLNQLLGWGHATVIDHLLAKKSCHKVIIDQFAAEHVVARALEKKRSDVVLTQRPRAEEDLVVAGASILARDAYLHGLSQLEAAWEIELPKGASSTVVAAGKKAVEKHGNTILEKVGKVHFKTCAEILS